MNTLMKNAKPLIEEPPDRRRLQKNEAVYDGGVF